MVEVSTDTSLDQTGSLLGFLSLQQSALMLGQAEVRRLWRMVTPWVSFDARVVVDGADEEWPAGWSGASVQLQASAISASMSSYSFEQREWYNSVLCWPSSTHHQTPTWIAYWTFCINHSEIISQLNPESLALFLIFSSGLERLLIRTFAKWSLLFFN